jgi:methionine-rich copper-binding protein CopC
MLVSTAPADGAELNEAPRTLALNFAHPVMLHTVSITGPDGAPVRATFRRQSAPVASWAIALPALVSGAYRARWSASGDGHQMQGELGFVVR